MYLAEVEDVVALSAVAALAEPVRRELYAYVRRQGRPVTRDEAAADAGISRKLAAFHLDRLVAAKLLDAGTDGDADGRIGRPPKTYRPSDLEVGVSIPTRRYELAAELLLEAAVTSERDGVTAREALMTAALRRGHEFGTEARHRLRSGRVGPDRALYRSSRTSPRSAGSSPCAATDALCGSGTARINGSPGTPGSSSAG